VSTLTGSLSTGVLSILALAPLSAIGLILASRHVAHAETNRIELARAAGEIV